MKTEVRELHPSEILRTVPPDKSFLFFEDIGKYTGRFARNLDEFFDIINQIDAKSVTFHSRRGDFTKWISEGLHDTQLAQRLKRIKKSASGEELRNKISRTVRRRLDELNEMLLLFETPLTPTR